jgi:hypothetical protein
MVAAMTGCAQRTELMRVRVEARSSHTKASPM